MTVPNPSSTPFLWGVSTSGYQSEGGYNQPGQPQNNWADAEQKGKVATTHQASGFWERYARDFETCQKMGVTGFRMSLEWTRIQPIDNVTPGEPAPFSYQAMDDYAARIASCREYGIEPVITLQHFTHPQWLGIDAWLETQTIESYVRYVETTIRYVNQRLVSHHHTQPIRWIITINEPNILIINTYLNGSFPSQKGTGIQKAFQAFDYLLAAHVKAYDAIHQVYEVEGWTSPHVSLNTYCSDLYWSEKIVWDLFSLAEHPEDELSDYFYRKAEAFETTLSQANLKFRKDIPFRIGSLIRRGMNWFGQQWIKPDTFKTTLMALRKSTRGKVFDYIAIDYYDPFLAHSVRFPGFSDLEFDFSNFKGWLMSSMQTKWWDWRSLPEGLYFFCKYYTEEYSSYPLLIAENGMALRRTKNNRTATFRRDQLQRSQFIKEHVAQVQKLRADGIPIVGYMHWSLTDNYEWGSYTPRFGLFSIDYEQGTERLETDHLGDRPSRTYAELIHKDASTTEKERNVQVPL